MASLTFNSVDLKTTIGTTATSFVKNQSTGSKNFTSAVQMDVASSTPSVPVTTNQMYWSQ